MLEFCRQSLDLKEVLERPLPLQVVDVVRGAGDRLVSVVVCESQLVSVLTMEQLTAADLELTGLSVQRIVVEVHPAGDGDPHTQLVGDCLVLVDPHSGHLLEDPLPAEGVQAVDLQLRVPDVLQNLGRLVDFLIMNMK